MGLLERGVESLGSKAQSGGPEPQQLHLVQELQNQGQRKRQTADWPPWGCLSERPDAQLHQPNR